MEVMKLLVMVKVIEITYLHLFNFLYFGMFAVLAPYLTYMESGYVPLKCDWVNLLISHVHEARVENDQLLCFILRRWK